MKIAIDARMYGLEHAGIGRYVMNLVSELSKLDRDNDYIIFLRKDYYTSLNLPNNWNKILIDFRHYSLKEQIILPKYLNTYKPDLVHFPHFNIPITYKGRFVVTIHDLLMHKLTGKEATTLNPLFYKIKRIGYWKVFNYAVTKSAKIIVPTKQVKEEVEKFYKISSAQIVITYEGIDTAWFQTAKQNITLKKYGLGEKYFIYTGNAYPHKNLKRAIEAIVNLNQKGISAQFAIVSARSVFTDRLKKLIQELNGEEYVRYLGFVPDEELVSLYRQSLGFLYPSLVEGFGLPGLEAMAAGTLAIVSDIPVFKEVYKNHAVYFNPYDFTSIEKTIKEVYQMPEKERIKKINEGMKHASSYSWEKMAKETLGVYRQVVYNHPK